MKNASTSKVVAAALAASMAFAAPALAQPGYRDDGRLEGGPPLFSGQDAYRGDNRGDWNDRDWQRRRPDFQTVQRDCSIAAIREAWNRNFYSAQYDDGPKLVEGRYGWEFRGKMRLHDRRGYAYADSWCEVGRNGEARIEFGKMRR